jgi:hypothetical protein
MFPQWTISSGKEQVMYVSIRKYKLNSQDAKTRGELVRQINEVFLPQISKASGFLSYYAVDTGTGTLATVSVFESQAGAEESNRRAADFVKSNLPALTLGPPEITAGEVIASQGSRGDARKATT